MEHFLYWFALVSLVAVLCAFIPIEVSNDYTDILHVCKHPALAMEYLLHWFALVSLVALLCAFILIEISNDYTEIQCVYIN